MSLFFTPATLKYLRMSGRVGGLKAALASLLELKPIIELQDGLLAARENVRTRAKAIDRLLDLTVQAWGATVPAEHSRHPRQGARGGARAIGQGAGQARLPRDPDGRPDGLSGGAWRAGHHRPLGLRVLPTARLCLTYPYYVPKKRCRL